jgi:dihydroxyacetone kinase-like protein
MMADSVNLVAAGPIVLDMVTVIQREQAWLCEIDGKIGDGDHGINMAKGFRLAGAKLTAMDGFDLPTGFATLGDTLLGDIGGSMGPLYGTFFTDMAETLEGQTELDSARCGLMWHAGLDAICGLGEAKIGDKTLVDTLAPAVSAFDRSLAEHAGFAECLAAMKRAAADGLESTRDMVAKLGRASRLGERSRGTLDAGAASCNLLVATLADGLIALLEVKP